MNDRSSNAALPFAGHRFLIGTDAAFRLDQDAHLINFAPETAPAPLCGELTHIRVHHREDLFRDRMARLAGARSVRVVPFRGEPYRFSRTGRVSWWRPETGSHLPKDHLYAKDATGRLHVVLHPGTGRGERYALRVIREVVLRCAEHRGWAVFHAAAAAVDDRGVLIAGSSGAGKTTVLTALAAHRRADLIGSDRVLVTETAARLVGVPITVRIAAGTLSGLTPRSGLPPHSVLPADFGTVRKAACTPHAFAHAFASRVQETAPLRLIVLPQLHDDEREVSIAFPRSAAARDALAAVCCTPNDEDWLRPWFADRTRPPAELARQAAGLMDAMVARGPVMTVTAGVHTPHLLERIAEAIARRLT
ncbi:hypothetical protein JCM4814A_78790 [Streptomyces phaeofaciens JCM 4814]|uniref:HPr kinase n=1 Tax=Streptomyces phaeofaciens TaxID=68254 RepID=A0A918HQD7_9ACTN|nr:hypothetical protein [Streptomyces phaeofaciens]GGT96122.1 hypothetical protein GCM10010226_87160 [Streptomyces phaeofaciens]